MRMSFLSVGLLLVTLALAIGLLRERTASISLSNALADRTERLMDLRSELRHLRHFHRSAIPEPAQFLQGLDASGDSTLAFDGVHDGLYYSLWSECEICPLNFAAIKEIEEVASDDFRVVALSLVDSLPALRRYARTHSLGIPVLQQPTGALIDLIPRYGTPFTLVVSDGCVVAGVAGEFRDEEIEQLKLYATRERGSLGQRDWLRPIDEC